MPTTCYDLKGRAEYKLVKSIERVLIDENIAPIESECFKIIHVFLFMAETGIRKPFMVNRRMSYNYWEVKQIINGLKKHEYLVDNVLYLDINGKHPDDIIQLVLMAGVVSGQILRKTVQ